jgi:hypothetical protein
MGPEIIEPDGLEFDEYETLAGGAWNSRPREEALERLLREAHDRLLRKTGLNDGDGIAFLNSIDAALKEGDHGTT